MDLLLKADHLFDGSGLQHDVSVAVSNGRIVEVGPRGRTAGKGVQVCESQFIMPGLIDMHAHIWGVSESVGDYFGPFKNYLNLLLLNGVTAVRDAGNYIDTVFQLRLWREQNLSPIVVSSGPILDESPLRGPHFRAVRSVEEAKSQVDLLHREGVDFVKVHATVRPEILRVIVQEAHARGLKVAGHLGATRVADAVDIGVDSIEHASTIIDESFVREQSQLEGLDRRRRLSRIWSSVDLDSGEVQSLMRKIASSKVYVCPTLIVVKRMRVDEDMSKVPGADFLESVWNFYKYMSKTSNPFTAHWSKQDRVMAAEGFKKMEEMVGRLFRMGCRIVAGTDVGNLFLVPGFSLIEELELYVESGASPLQALASATKVAAEWLGREDMGVVRPNALANMVLIGGDPSKHIADIEKLEQVVLEGNLMGRDEIEKKLEGV